MEQGRISDTILYWSEQAVSGLSEVAFINAMFGIETAMSLGTFSSWLSAVKSVSLEDMLRGSGPFTVFLADDAAHATTVDALSAILHEAIDGQNWWNGD